MFPIFAITLILFSAWIPLYFLLLFPCFRLGVLVPSPSCAQFTYRDTERKTVVVVRWTRQRLGERLAMTFLDFFPGGGEKGARY